MSKSRVRVEILVRIIADLVILNVSLWAGLLPQLLRPGYTLPLLGVWWPSACLISAIAPLVFYKMGFYTKGRSYSGKYKALVIIQAATLLFVIDALCLYFLRLQPSFPRSSFLLDWVISSGVLLSARLWSKVWKYVVIQESQREQAIINRERQSVLVIGGAGYIGSALLPKLLDRGYHVRLLDCFLYGDEPIAPFIQHPNLEIHRGDFRNVDTVVAAMRNMNSVIHLGGLVGDPACAIDEELTLQVNLIATRMIAQVAKGNGISRFVFASSCSVYGASDQILNEKSSLNPVSLYARSKIASENVLLSFRGGGFEPVILRFGTIYGLSGRTRFDLVVNLLAAKALVDKVITVYGKDQWRPFLHVHDAGRAVMAALDAPSESVEPVIFNVGCDEQNKTLGQVGEIIQTMVPGAVLHCTEDNVDRRNYRVEFRRIREAIGFQPVWKIEAGVQQVLDAIGSGKVTNYQDSRYSNVKFLSEPDGREQLPVMEDWVTQFMQIPTPIKVKAIAAGQLS
jgi:nucleoside-diphosphate-sugar epimerase